MNSRSMAWSQSLGILSFASRDHFFCLDLRADHGGAHAREKRDDNFRIPALGRYPALIFQRDLRRIRSSAVGFHRDVWIKWADKKDKKNNGVSEDDDNSADEQAEEDEERSAEAMAVAVANGRFEGGTGRSVNFIVFKSFQLKLIVGM